jgi:hypothetical protein
MCRLGKSPRVKYEGRSYKRCSTSWKDFFFVKKKVVVYYESMKRNLKIMMEDYKLRDLRVSHFVLGQTED